MQHENLRICTPPNKVQYKTTKTSYTSFALMGHMRIVSRMRAQDCTAAFDSSSTLTNDCKSEGRKTGTGECDASEAHD